ncbi:MAG: sulfite exporter TauE/SafE family protein [Rhodobacteraceae bacterium]|nr:sulfite exporter TauE/SafE family protein [Paracoccaceae bacterium]
MFQIFDSFDPTIVAVLSLALFVAGCVRGFAGFGAGMIYMPIATSLLYPPMAAAGFLFLDMVIALPLVTKAVKICDWRTIIPAVVASVIFVHAGTWFLANADVLVLRWVIFGIVASLLVLLLSGWRYHRRPTSSISFGVGAVAGVLGGVSQVSGPPVVAFWLSSASETAVVRANLIVFFALAGVGSMVAYVLNGFYTLDVWRFLVFAAPAYALGLFLGSKGFGRANPKFYRWIAYTLIAISAITSMPALDGLIR